MKKLLSLIASLALVFTLAGCGGEEKPVNPDGGEKEKIELKVWGPQNDQELLKKLGEEFKALPENAKYDINFTFAIVGEPDAREKYFEDPATAADIFAFPDDQLRDLVSGGALYEVTRKKDDIISRNGEGSVNAFTLDGKLYGYPMTADNGYFMYYDKSVFTEEDVKNLGTMLEVAEKAHKKVFMDLANGWYIASFFMANGGTLTIDENGKQVCNFNDANGVAVGEYIKQFTAHPAYINGDDTVLTGGFGDTIAAGISGTWNADAIKAKLGDNFAATKLPEITLADGKTIQMSSFGGYKGIGVNSQTKHPVVAMDFANYITNEASQIARFESRAAGPSNINAANSEAVQANVVLSALAYQNQFSVGQGSVLGSYWEPSKAFGNAMINKDYSKSIQEYLDAMVEQICA